LEDFQPEKLMEEIRTMDWGWVAAAVLFDILVYFLQGWRWSLLLRPVENIPYMRSIRAIYVGLFANEVLPLRTGEVIRCYLQARWSKIPVSVALSSAIIERIFDGIWLCICLVVCTYIVEVPGLIEANLYIVLVFVAIAAALLWGAMFARKRTHDLFARHRLTRHLNVLLDDLYLIGHSPFLYLSAAASLPYLLLQVLPIYALTSAYGLPISLGQAFVIMVFLRLVSVVPQAPGNLGVYQAAAVLSLMLFGVEEGIAKRFSFVMWACVTLPLLVAGFFALTVTGLKLREIRQEADSARAHEVAPARETGAV
jgi:uncharacterized protein (TIRG00374 family)